MSDFDPRWRLGFSVLVLTLVGINVAQHPGESIIMIEVGVIGVVAALWVGWTALRDLGKPRDGE